jgi:transcriptional regulator with AAA-type ATPase domain
MQWRRRRAYPACAKWCHFSRSSVLCAAHAEAPLSYTLDTMSEGNHTTLIGADPSTVAGLSGGEERTDRLPIFVLKIVGGEDDGSLFPLDWTRSARVLVGTSAACDVKLKDPRVSRRHVALGPQGSYLQITDLDSTNGTRVNSVRVLDALLKGGETLTIGDTTVRLLRTGDANNPMVHAGDRFGRVLGRSSEMQRVFVLGARLAQTNLPLVVEGETGTGKELFAEALHEASQRGQGPYGMLAGSASAAELAASLADDGVFQQSVGGTVVLDEPAELPLPAQARLLSLVARHGDTVRLLATTKRNLDRESEAGRLREDLLFRIAGGRIELPPLRRRHGDIALLATHFWGIAGATGSPPPDLLAQLHDYHWPGNVREFRHAVDRAVALGEQYSLSPGLQRDTKGGADSELMDRLLSMDLSLQQARAVLVSDFEQRYVEVALKRHGGNVTRAAAASGLTRRYFHMLRAKQK